MKKILISFFALLLWSVSVVAEEPIKILGIGNSFTVDAMEQHLQPIMTAMEKPAIMGYPYRGATTLKQHDTWKARTDTFVYDYREFRDGVCTKTGTKSSNLVSKIEKEAWDYVIIQTDHNNSGQMSSYEPYLTSLIGFVKEHCSNSNVKIGLYMTWSYDATSSSFPSYYKAADKNKEMYDSIVSCVSRIMSQHDDIFLIPCGTAIQNARTSYKGQTLNRDGYHLNTEYGRYIASLCWAKAICGFVPSEVTYKPVGISDYCANMCRAAVDSAFLKPYAVSSLQENFGTSDDENQPADESRLDRVSFNGLNVPIKEGQYEYTVLVNAALGNTVTMYSFPKSTVADQNIVDELGADIQKDDEKYGYFPLTAPAANKMVTYVNTISAQDQVHRTTYTFHLVGTEVSNLVYYISSKEDLVAFAAAVNGGQYGLNAVLTQDIDLGYERNNYWKTPIGTIAHPYTGTFDGRGYTLKNFNIYCKDDADLLAMKELGLFGAIQGATIKNLGMTTTMDEIYVANPTSGSGITTNNVTCCGALVGQMAASTISYCTISADFNSNLGTAAPCGAICGREVGDQGASVIEYCRVSGAWNTRSKNYFGAFVGWANNLTIRNSSSHVTLPLSTDANVYFGGFIGVARTDESDRKVSIENCYMAGSIKDARTSKNKDIYLGAYYGYVFDAKSEINNCYWLEESAPAVYGTKKSAVTNPPTATTFPADDLTNGNLVAKLNGSFVQGSNYPVFAGEVITDPEMRGKFTVNKAVTEFGWTAGAVILDVPLGNVTLSTENPSKKSNGTFKNGTQWRVFYLYDNGPLTIKADDGYWIDHVKFTYTAGGNGILVNQPGAGQSAIWSSGDTINVKDTQRKWYVGNTSGGQEGLLGFTRFEVTYYKLPTSIVMADSMSVAVGSSFQIGEVTPADAYHVWSSDNEAAVTVDQNGLITAVGAGKATITVTSKNNITKSCVVTVAANDGESFTENFNAYGIISAYSNDVVTKYNLTNGISWSLRNVKRDATTMIESQQGVGLQYRVGETKNKDKNYIAYQSVNEEGGVKAVSFQWRAVDADKDVQFDVDDANGYLTKYHEVLPASSLNQEVRTFAREMNYAQNNFFRIRLANANSSNVVFGPLTITPYLLYKEKVVNLDAEDLVEDNFKYTNKALINNVPEAEEENISYAIKGSKVADIDGKTGELTIKGAGKDTVVATWGNVSTSYEVNVTLADPGLYFAIQEAEALLNTGSYTQKAQTTEETSGAISYAVIEKPEGATANVIDDGVVTFNMVGDYTIQAIVAKAMPYEADTATYALKVTSLPVPTIVVKDTTVSMNSGKFTNPLQAPEGIGDKHYSSSNKNVATVVASTGELTIVGEGTTVITLQIEQGASYAATEAAYTLTVNDPGETKLKENFVPQGSWGTSATEINGRLFKWNTYNTRRNNSKEKLANGDSAVWFGSDGTSWIESQDMIEGGIKRVSFYFNKYDNNTVNLKFLLAIDGVVVDSACQDNVAGTTRAAEDFWFNHNLSVQKNAKLRISAPVAGVTSHLGYVNITPYLLYTEKNVNALAQSGPYTNTALINNTGTKPSYSISCQSDTAEIDADGAVTIYKTATATVTASWGEVSTSYTINMSAKSLPTVTLDNTTMSAFDIYTPAPVAKIGEDTIKGAQWTYTSSNPNVAKVEGGVFTITGTGTSSIIATLVAGEEYVSASDTAALVVYEPTVGVWKEMYDSLESTGDAYNKATEPTPFFSKNKAYRWQVRNYQYNNADNNKVNGEDGIRIRTEDNKNNYLATATPYEGGVKAAFFNWKMAGSADKTSDFTVSVTETSHSNYSKKVQIDAAGGQYYSFVDNSINYKANGMFRVKVNADNKATIFGPMTIKPYLLYTRKDTTVKAMDYVGTANKLINKDTIDNTNGEGVITYAIENAASKTDIATIDATTGEVTIVGGGTVKVMAIWKHDAASAPNDSVTTSYTLRINRTTIEPATLSFEMEGSVEKTMNDGAFSNTLSGMPEGAGAVSYTSSKPSVADVDGNGLVTIKGAGTTTITANVAVSAMYSAASKSYTLTVTEPTDETRIGEIFSGKLWTVDDTSVEGDLGTWNAFNSRRKTTDTMEDGQPAIFFVGNKYSYLETQGKLEGGIKRMSFVWYRSYWSEGDTVSKTDPHNFSILMDGQVMDTIDVAKEGWSQYNNYSHNFGVMKNVQLKLMNSSYGATKMDTIRIVPYIYYTAKVIDTLYAKVQAPFANTGFINNTHDQGVLKYISSNEAVATVDGEGNVTALQASEEPVTITAIWKPSAEAQDSVTASYQLVLHGKVARNAYFENPAKSVMRGDTIDSDLQYDTEEGDVPATPAITYYSSDTTVAVVLGNQIKAVGGGTAVITAKIDSTKMFRADSAEYNLTVTYMPEEGTYWKETFSRITSNQTKSGTYDVTGDDGVQKKWQRSNCYYTDTIGNKDTKGLRIRYDGYIASQQPLEGGVKELVFDWRVYNNSTFTEHFFITVGDSTIDYSYGNLPSKNTTIPFAHSFNMKHNVDLKIQNDSDASLAHIIISPIKVIPYLCYTVKEHVMNVGETYTNTSLIDNRDDSVDVQYSFVENDVDFATINSSTGEVSATNYGIAHVKAQWGEVSTTYLLVVIGENQTLISLMRNDSTDDKEYIINDRNAVMPVISQPTREGYRFNAYYSEAQGGTRFTRTIIRNSKDSTDWVADRKIGGVTYVDGDRYWVYEGSNYTLYAQWKPELTIVLDQQKADKVGTEQVVTAHCENNNSVNLMKDITVPSKTGATFRGYFTDSLGKGVQLVDEKGSFIADVDGYTNELKMWQKEVGDTLYAKWAHHVTYAIGAGRCDTCDIPVDSTDYVTGDTVTLVAVDTLYNPGHNWKGWRISYFDVRDSIEYPVDTLSGGKFIMPDYDVMAHGVWELIITSDTTVNTSTEVSAIRDSISVTIIKEGVLNINSNKTLDTVFVNDGGKINVGSGILTVNDLVIRATSSATGTSGQIINADASKFDIKGAAYFDLTLAKGGTNQQWHAFTVPFKVDMMNGIFDLDSNQLKAEVNYAIMVYQGEVRAQGEYGWKKVQKTGNTILQPGTFYLMATDGRRTTYRMKMYGGFSVASTDIEVFAYDSAQAEAIDKGWNGIGNSQLQYCGVNATVQVLDPVAYAYKAIPASQAAQFAVGTPFFYQSGENGSISLKTGEAAAPMRAMVKELKEIGITLANEDYTDYLYISSTDEAKNEYQIGRDLIRMSMTSTPEVPQICAKAYNTSLSVIDLPMVNDEVTYALSLYAPKKSNYTMTAQQVEGYEIFLTKDGEIIWNLSMSAYDVELTKGDTDTYGLLVRKVDNTTTMLEGVRGNADGVQKFIYDDQLILIRDGKQYNGTGSLIK